MRFNTIARTRDKLRFVAILSKLLRFGLKLLGRPEQFIINRKNIRWSVDAAEAIDCCLILTGGYEPEVQSMYKRLLGPGDVVVDIGANIGAHTLPMANLVGDDGIVYAIEATRFAQNKLQTNLALNPMLEKRVNCQHVFLTSDKADSTESVSASWNIAESIDSINRNQLDGGMSCEISGARKISFDDWALEMGLKQLNLLKIDVDGNEVSVLKGALATLKTFMPKILMELSPIHYENRQERFIEQWQLLKDIGYRFYDENGEELLAPAEEIEKAIPRGVLVNVLGVMA